MRQPDVRRYLFDIQCACSLIREFTEGMTFEEYKADVRTHSAVERQFEIIGEALNQMLRVFPEMEENVSHAPRIISFRNALIHGYADVSHKVVWGIVESGLPLLSAEVQALLSGDLQP